MPSDASAYIHTGKETLVDVFPTSLNIFAVCPPRISEKHRHPKKLVLGNLVGILRTSVPKYKALLYAVIKCKRSYNFGQSGVRYESALVRFLIAPLSASVFFRYWPSQTRNASERSSSYFRATVRSSGSSGTWLTSSP